MIRISKRLITNCLLIIFSIFPSAFAQGTVTVTGTDLAPTFSPGTSTPIVSLSFVIAGSPMINYIKVDRTGTATNADVPTAKLYRDVNQNNVVDGGDVQLDRTRTFQGTETQNAYFQALSYYPSTSENLLIVYDVAAGANTSNTAGASMPAGYITGGSGTVITFLGITTGNQPLPVELASFTASVEDKTVNMKWQTATEVNNFGFEIERSQTSKVKSETWEKVGFVQGHGNSNSPKSYTFTDNLALAHNLDLDHLQYRLKQIDFDGKFEYSGIITVKLETPANFALLQNFPNPFNPSTIIRFELPKESNVTLKVFNILGEEVATLVNKVMTPGRQEVTFDGSKLASGMYIYRIQAGNFVEVKKLLLLK
ncbi:MAG: T9SS type A sorting domain-containing protein [Bacteroidetes bacterium]|nr:T9SS type A sorting domain-containing protein [Bacteroidota bacterium]